MWKERLIRILLISLVGLLILGVARGLVGWREKQKVAGKTVSLPTKQIGEKIEDVGEDILGTVIKIFPGANFSTSEVSEDLTSEVSGVEEYLPGEENSSFSDPGSNLETKTETVKIIETQTKEIIEIIKELPQEQIETIKRQVFKEFCQEVCQEILVGE